MRKNRESQILEVLIQSERAQTIKSLSDELGVSQTSIRNALDGVETLAKTWELEVIRERGVGILLTGSSFHKNRFLNAKEITPGALNKEDNLDYLILELVDKQGTYITIENLSQRLFLSRSTTQAYVMELQSRLKAHNVIVETRKKKGVRLLGEELDVRNVYSKALSRQRHKAIDTGDLRNQIFQTLRIDPDYIFVILRKFQENYNYLFSDESFDGLVIHIAIAIRRIMDQQMVEHGVVYDVSDYEFEFEISKMLSSSIEEHYNIKYNDHELYFLFLHLISSKVIKERKVIPNVSQESSLDTVALVAKEIVELVQNTKQIVVGEIRFLDNLIIHLRPALNRIEFGFKYENPLREMIKQEYPVAYGLAWMSNSIFKHYLGKELTEDEASYIAVHIQSMIEASDQKLRVIVVCSSGIGISQLLVSRIQSQFPNLNVVATESVYSFAKHSNPNRADFVLSTFPVESTLPVIIVNPLLTQHDVMMLQEFTEQYREGPKNILSEIHVETLLQKSWDSQEKVIQNVSKYLEIKELVTSEFEEEVYKREAVNSTSIGMKVALPHAAYHTVLKTNLTFVTLQKPILWGDDAVDLIVFIALTESDSFKLSHRLREIYYKLYSESEHLKLVAQVSRDSFINILTTKEKL